MKIVNTCERPRTGFYHGNAIRGLWVIEIPMSNGTSYRYRPMVWRDMCRIWKAYYSLGIIVGLYRLNGTLS